MSLAALRCLLSLDFELAVFFEKCYNKKNKMSHFAEIYKSEELY